MKILAKRVLLPVVIGGAIGLLMARKIPLAQCVMTKENRVANYDQYGYREINSVADTCAIYPKTAQEVSERSTAVQKRVLERIKELTALPVQQYNQKTVLQAFDALRSDVGSEMAAFYLIKSVSPDEKLLEAAEKESVALGQFLIEHVDSNKALYYVMKTYAEEAAQDEQLSEEDRYFLRKVIENFELQGLNLPDDKQKELLVLKKRCTELESEFHRLIDQDATTLKLSEEALAGVHDDFKKELQQEGDLYVLHLNYPTHSAVMNYCTVEDTRNQYFKAFQNRGYPGNEPVLQELIRKRDECAKLLGFESYAAYDLTQQMIRTPEHAWEFERELQGRARALADQDFKKLISDLPEGITLTADGKMKPWDSAYIMTHFKKKHYSIDERHFAEYFPMEKTVAGLIHIYEQFFSLRIQPVSVKGMWHDDVSLLQVKDKASDKVLGYVFLDMFPRPKKYGHAAAFEGMFALAKNDGTRRPGIVTLVCNFTKPTTEKPSLLKYDEVTTFFHEFGHAIHLILGATHYAATSGFNTEVDFVELPSQMLENWMEDRSILKLISSHYQTGEPLPDELIEQRLALLKFGQGLFVVRQLQLGMVSLAFFGPRTDESLFNTYKRIYEENVKHVLFDDATHAYCNFGHLIGYGPKYYGYLWSLALAYDVFEQIEKQGLLNPEAGKKYVDAILSKGGSCDANDMIRDYLGREPNFDAFYRKMGLEKGK